MYYNTSRVAEVNGMNGANAYQIGPNSSVLLLDSNLPIVYLKQTDGAGYATINAFDLVEHKDPQAKSMEDINSRLERLENSIEQLIKKHTEPSEQLDEQSTSKASNSTL